jgi:hypothetical protein
MKTGPKATTGYDLSLTELEQSFVMRIGSAAGEAIAAKLDLGPAQHDEVVLAKARVDGCAAGMQRRLDTADLPHLLYDEAENPRWKDVASRCLSCTNCTMVCPTCFCHTVVDQEEIDSNLSRRVRK